MLSRESRVNFIKNQESFDFRFDSFKQAKPGLLTFIINDFEMLDLLLDKKAPINDGLNGCFSTALACAICHASRFNDDKVARYLLSKGATMHQGYKNNYPYWIENDNKMYLGQ